MLKEEKLKQSVDKHFGAVLSIDCEFECDERTLCSDYARHIVGSC